MHAVDEAKLCDDCSDKSARIDERLVTTRSEDPGFCDGREDRVTFDVCLAAVVRECGGGVLCDDCKHTALERAVS
jgi:hypothetical protein